MTGPGFHEFLIRGANDRLLTDRELDHEVVPRNGLFVAYTNELYRRAEAAGGLFTPEAGPLWEWVRSVQYGAVRAPLELIAHVAENDLPYSDILTADFVMANPPAAEAYGASTAFDDPQDLHEFRPSEIVSYYRDDESKETVVAFTEGTVLHVVEPGDLTTDYPHAGILNTTAFLLRYPTTATNRNRARSRWTHYHFLGLDVEKSASRTTDPVALADTNNPTMHNPACTVCHSALDPVAGTFQNYGDEGLYRDQWGGMDALDAHYKRDYSAGQGEFDVSAQSHELRETLAVQATLPAGMSVVRLTPYFDPPNPEGSEAWWNGGFGEVRVVDGSGAVVHRVDLAELHGARRPDSDDEWLCGKVREQSGIRFFESHFCPQEFPVELDMAGAHTVEVEVWVYADRDVGERRRLLSMDVGRYLTGDTWYRDMRSPGFDGGLAPDPDNSLQWFAKRVAADPRFAEATVRFWWPAIMGSEVAEPPAEGDADFDGRLLASNAQSAEVTRLANAFRGGFQGGAHHNLKDLLTELALSKWFRADASANADPVRATALASAGAKRLLTPEELVRKTVALTGFDWNRRRGQSWRHPGERLDWTNTDDQYGLLYGGIDSDGITKRGRDLTSVMAGVAQRHAAATSCPVVMKDFYLLDETDRLLFRGIDTDVSPASEFGGTFEIAAGSRSEIETLSIQGTLRTGEARVSLAYLNDFWDEDLGDRDILLDRLTIRSGNELVYELEMEEFNHPHDCHHIEQEAFHLSSTGSRCTLEVPVVIPRDGDYRVEVAAWGDQAGDALPKLAVAVHSDTERSAGSRTIRTKLAELHHKLLGVEADMDSEDVRSTYDFFIDVWQRNRNSDEVSFHSMRCDWASDAHYFDGIADHLWQTELDEWGNERGWDWDAANDLIWRDTNMPDPHYVARTWVAVLAYLMSDPRYLHL